MWQFKVFFDFSLQNYYEKCVNLNAIFAFAKIVIIDL